MKKPAKYHSSLAPGSPPKPLSSFCIVIANPSADGCGNLILHFSFCILHSAPSPIVPASKFHTARTMLPSGEALKMRNFVGVLWNSSPVLASPLGRPRIGSRMALKAFKFTPVTCAAYLPRRESTTSLMARMCSPVVPQQPPMIETPTAINSRAFSANRAGDSV